MTDYSPTVAVFGATGNLGKYISEALLDKQRRKKFKDVVFFTRGSSSSPTQFQEWQKAGLARIVKTATDTSEMTDQLKGVDVVVNAIGTKGNELRKQVVQAMVKANIKVYFPSEFGVDHVDHDFSYPEWDKKKEHFRMAQELLPNTKVVRVFAGLFLEDSIGPWFGFDTKTGNYEAYGSGSTKATYTSLGDVGRAVAELCLMQPNKLPGEVHLRGDIQSIAEIANIMKSKNGSEIKVIETNLEQSKAKVLSADKFDPAGALRFLMGEGKIQHTPEVMGHDNELVNPHQSRWVWKTMVDLANDTGGRPWADTY